MECKECRMAQNSDGNIAAERAFYQSVIKRKNVVALLFFVLAAIQALCFTGYAIYNKWVDAQFETVSEDIRVISDDDGDANYIGNDGDITYGSGTR